MPAKPERILITADAVGGVWQYTVDLAAALEAQGTEVVIACMGPAPSVAQRGQIADLENVRLEHGLFALEWMQGCDKDLQLAGDWLLELAARFQPTLVHVNGYAHAALKWETPAVCVAHSCVATWWQAVHGKPAPREWDRYCERVSAGLNAASVIVSPTAAMAAALSRTYIFDETKLRVIPNFSSVPVFRSAAKLPLIMAAGRVWDESKNLLMLNQIAPALKWPVEIAGNSVSPSNRRTPVENVRLVGALPHLELLHRMASASIFAHPALYEPFGLAPLEAARCGCCLVLSDIPSLREIWSGCAEFVDPRDPEQWRFELNRLAGDREERARLAALACKRSERFRQAATLDAYLTAYSDIAQDVSAGAAA